MTPELWAARVKDAVQRGKAEPGAAASDLLELADEVARQIPSAFSSWHLTQTLSIAATIVEDTDAEVAIAAVSRQVTQLRQDLTGSADHLSSAASHLALMLFKVGRAEEANELVREAIKASAIAPVPNLALELALAEFRKRAQQRS